jgi:phosphogluconate dehydratase
MAAASGIDLTWHDFAKLSSVVPLLARIYPNGSADINQFQAAGGTARLFQSLLEAGLMHEDVLTVAGPGLSRYCSTPSLTEAGIRWEPAARGDADSERASFAVLRTPAEPFAADSGIRVLDGNLGRSVAKVSALKMESRIIEAPARVFDNQQDFLAAFDRDEFVDDVVVVVRFQGPKANGMPELHRLTPALGVLQDRGHRVALITDGRMSGASGKAPAALHCTPEAAEGGPLSRLQDGDIIRFDTVADTLNVIGVELSERAVAQAPFGTDEGTGRELFRLFRNTVTGAEAGASVFA